MALESDLTSHEEMLVVQLQTVGETLYECIPRRLKDWTGLIEFFWLNLFFRVLLNSTSFSTMQRWFTELGSILIWKEQLEVPVGEEQQARLLQTDRLANALEDDLRLVTIKCWIFTVRDSCKINTCVMSALTCVSLGRRMRGSWRFCSSTTPSSKGPLQSRNASLYWSLSMPSRRQAWTMIYNRFQMVFVVYAPKKTYQHFK